MSAIIEADIIENEHGEVVQIGDDEVAAFTWIWTAGADINATAHNLTFYRIGNVVHFHAASFGTSAPAGWLVGASATAATISSKTGSVIPQQFRPLTDRVVPIMVETNSVFGWGEALIANTGAVTIGATTDPTTLAAFTVAQPFGFQFRGSYIV